MEVEASVIVAVGTWRLARTARLLTALAACLALSSLAGCSFEEGALVSSEHRPSVAPPSSSGGGGGSSGEPNEPAKPPLVGNADASAPPDGNDGASKPGIDAAAAPEDAGMDGASDAPDAGHDTPDTGTTPDSGCGEKPACVCAHERLETPSDPCAARDCPLAECAPDDGCVLKRFESSVYYLCSDARAQGAAEERCETIEGMHLVYIEDEDEDAFLDGVADGKIWIGAVVDEGVWSWLDGTPFYDEDSGEPVDGAYVDWDQGSSEPNGIGVGAGSVTCAILWSDTSAWADTNCTALNPYVCEREL